MPQRVPVPRLAASYFSLGARVARGALFQRREGVVVEVVSLDLDQRLAWRRRAIRNRIAIDGLRENGSGADYEHDRPVSRA